MIPLRRATRVALALALATAVASSGCEASGAADAPDVDAQASEMPAADADEERDVEVASSDDEGGPADVTVGPDAPAVGDALPEVTDATGSDADAAGTPDADGAADAPDAEPPVEVHHSELFRTREVVGQLYVWDGAPGTAFEVLDPAGALVATGISDDLGSLVFRGLEPGLGYVVRMAADPDEYAGPLRVHSIESSMPDEAFYAGQILEPGFGYIETRDGTTLSVFVSLPGPPEDGPYPTVVNYSGYTPSRPGRPIGGTAELFCDIYPVLCNAPDYPEGLIAGVLGYATVGVNVRGTTCSGGAYDYFDVPQLLDGYDVIEVVARQPWVKHGKVGMVGLSFPGITQLFVAAQRPPSLAAIAPMSVIGDTGSSTLLPGGIYNQGFALQWIGYVLNNADPFDHGWVNDLIADGDTVCADNQKLHGQKLDAVTKALDNPYYSDEVAKPIDPSSFVDRIEVPVMLVGQWQDEQTGPHFPILASAFSGSPAFRMTATNGVHIDGYSPQKLLEWFEFLSFYVAREVPVFDPTFAVMVPSFMEEVFGAPLEIPPQRFEPGDDLEAALAVFEADPPIRVLFESGSAPELPPGAPEAAFEQRFDAWPLPETVARRWYLQPDGGLADEPPGSDGGASVFVPDPAAGGQDTLASGPVEALQPDWDYPPLAEGRALAFETAPLAEDLVLVGHGSVDLWLRSTASDADLEACLTEVRPDGQEAWVQCGWLRASHRKLRADATELRPVKSHYLADLEPLVPNEWTEARVEIMPMGHVFRAGSRLRLAIDTPGGSMARWTFILLDWGDELPTHTIGHDAAHPSSVALPMIPTVDVPTPLPPCHALRGQPCREHVPFANSPASDL